MIYKVQMAGGGGVPKTNRVRQQESWMFDVINRVFQKVYFFGSLFEHFLRKRQEVALI